MGGVVVYRLLTAIKNDVPGCVFGGMVEGSKIHSKNCLQQSKKHPLQSSLKTGADQLCRFVADVSRRKR